ncbi:MAG: hypothetical protein QM757_40880 [Paludibaculum sp.]
MKTIEFPVQKMFKVSRRRGFNYRDHIQALRQLSGRLASDFFGFGGGARCVSFGDSASAAACPSAAFTPPADWPTMQQSFCEPWQSSVRGSARPSQIYRRWAAARLAAFGIVGALTFTNKPQYAAASCSAIFAAGGRQRIADPTPTIRTSTEYDAEHASGRVS